MTLGLEVYLPKSNAAQYSLGESRPLTREEGELLHSRRWPLPPSPLKRLSQRHHAVARAIASGQMTDVEIAACYNYHKQNIVILRQDPTFMELVEFYRARADAEVMSTFERLSGVAADALDLIEERMQDPEERQKISVDQAIRIATMGTDRTGLGPTSKQEVNVNVGLAERMERARKRHDEMKTIEGVARVA